MVLPDYTVTVEHMSTGMVTEYLSNTCSKASTVDFAGLADRNKATVHNQTTDAIGW